MPWQIYRDDPHWVPPVIADQKKFIDPWRGPFFTHGSQARLFLARRNGQFVGRISAQVNQRHNDVYADGKGFFGFFDCDDDQEVCSALFTAAEDYLRNHGCSVIEGPFSFSIYDEIGILIDGFDTDPYVLNLHNKAYYSRLVENAGFSKSVD